MSQMIQDVLESKRKNIPDTPLYIFYRRLLVAIIMVPMLGISAIECLAFTRGGILFDLIFNSDKILKGKDESIFEKGILASGLDLNAWTLYVCVFLTLTMIGVIFWFIKPKTEAGIKGAIWWLPIAIGIGEVLIAYASLTYDGSQAGKVGLGFTAFTFIVGLIIGLKSLPLRNSETKIPRHRDEHQNVHSSMTHPYSIYVWQPPLTAHSEGHWSEPAQCFTEQDALYIANLMHRDSKAVIKVVRYGLNLVCFPDKHAVELVEKQIARHHEPRIIEEPEITLF